MNKSTSGVYIRDLNKYEVEVLTVQERIAFAAKIWYHILKGWANTPGHGTHCESVNWLNKCRFGLQHDYATKSRAWNHGDLHYGPVHSSCRCRHLYLFCWRCGGRPSRSLGLLGSRIRVWVGWNAHSREIEGRSQCVEEASWHDAFFFRELKAGILKLQDLRTNEVGTKLDKLHGQDWRSFLVCREFVDPLATWFFDTTFNVVGAKKLFDFRFCKFVIVSIPR